MHNCVHLGFLLEINFVFCAFICLSFYAIIGFSCNCFCVVYTKCKPCYVMIQDTYSSLDLSQWTEHLSHGLLSLKIASSLCSAKLPKLQSFWKWPFCNGGCNMLLKIVFLSSFSFIFVAKISHDGFPWVRITAWSCTLIGQHFMVWTFSAGRTTLKLRSHYWLSVQSHFT